MSHTKRLSIVVPSVVAAAALLGACSSGGGYGGGSSSSQAAAPPASSSSSSAAAAAAPAPSGHTVTATLTEFHIALSSATLSPGTWTFKVKNAGSITHALAVDGSGVSDKSTSDLSPGKTATLTVKLSAGKYDVFCPVGNHKMEGMDETVQVR